VRWVSVALSADPAGSELVRLRQTAVATLPGRRTQPNALPVLSEGADTYCLPSAVISPESSQCSPQQRRTAAQYVRNVDTARDT